MYSYVRAASTYPVLTTRYHVSRKPISSFLNRYCSIRTKKPTTIVALSARGNFSHFEPKLLYACRDIRIRYDSYHERFRRIRRRRGKIVAVKVTRVYIYTQARVPAATKIFFFFSHLHVGIGIGSVCDRESNALKTSLNVTLKAPRGERAALKFSFFSTIFPVHVQALVRRYKATLGREK